MSSRDWCSLFFIFFGQISEFVFAYKLMCDVTQDKDVIRMIRWHVIFLSGVIFWSIFCWEDLDYDHNILVAS